MKHPLSVSKYTLPRLPRIVSRPRLIRRLEKNREKKIVLVTGQAAQGKSTLVADYLSSMNGRAAWLHLNKKESDHVNFFYLLIHALQFAFKEIDLSSFLKNPHITLGTREEVPRYKERLISLLNQFASPFQIVLDGLDTLQSEASSFQLIETMSENIPDGSVLYLITRVLPPLRIERFRLKQEALKLSNDDLAFTREEIKKFFRMSLDLKLSEKQNEQVHHITGGWVGGLILVSESLSRLPKKERAGYLSEHLPVDLSKETLSFFSEEIFHAQPEGIKSFLIKSSILEIIDSDILVDIVDRKKVQLYIQELVRRNLFIESIFDENRGWMYRYIQLFKDFLQSMFRKTYDADSQRLLLVKTANLYWKRDRFEEAIQYFLKAGAYEKAAGGIKKIGMDLAIRGRFSDLARFIQALPQEMISDDPWLLYFLTLTRKISGGNRNIDDLKSCLKQFEDSGDQRGYILSLAFLIETLVFYGVDPNEISVWTQKGEMLLRSLSSMSYFAYAKTTLWLQIGFGLITGGNLHKGLSACRNAYLMAGKIGDVTLQINATIISVLGLSLAGEFQQADEALERLGDFIGGSDSPEYRTLQHLVKIDLTLNRGEFNTVKVLLEKARRDIEMFGLLFLYPALIDATGLLHIYQREFSEADKARRHLSDVAVLTSSRYYGGLSHRLAGMLQYHNGQYRKALAFSQMAVERLSVTTTEGLHISQVKELLGLIRLNLGEYRRAEQNLMEVVDYFDRTGSPIAFAECRLALALIKHAQGNRKAAESHLIEGFQIAEAKQYEHMLIMSPLDFLRACILAVELEVKPAVDYAVHLISTRLSSAGEPELEKLSSQQGTKNREIALEVKRSIHRTRAPILDIQTLGGFWVLRDGKIPVKDKDWAGKRPKMLLKAILVHGGREIPKDILIDDLWPDGRPESVQRNLKVNLHRLRKVLEPDLNPKFGSSYIHLKNNLVTLDNELCRVDVDRFLALFKQIKQSWDTGDPERLLALCRRAEEIYRGDFLPEEPYLSWTELKRNMLREHYLTILAKIAEIYETRESLDRAVDYYQLITRADPFKEHAHKHLMRLYSAMGMRSAALKVYDEFKSFIDKEIGETPDPSTMVLYRKILNLH